MSDQDAHVPTPQETRIYEALGAGDHDTIQDLRLEAENAEQEKDADSGLTPVEQYELDYQFAWTHYQADHEAPEEERIENTADQVASENQEDTA